MTQLRMGAAAVLTLAALSTAVGPTTAQVANAGVAPADATTTAAERHGWTDLVRSDEFDGDALGPDWNVYDSPGHADNGVRSPDQVTVADGILRITGTPDGTTAGMAWMPGRMYGRWEARARFPAGCACYHPVLILWPDANDFPAGGEIDYAEVFDATRQELNFFLHYGRDNRQLHDSVRVDMTRWHHFAVEWTADHVTGFLDGEPFFHTDRREVLPPRPMHQTIQLDWFPQDGAGDDAVMEVAWVRQYGL